MASNPAPGELELVRAFINTWNADDDVENVPGPAELHDWLVAHDLLDAGARVTAADHRQAIEVREALRAVLLANAGLDLDPGAAPVLDAAARRARLAVRFDEHGHVHTEPEAGGGAGAGGRRAPIPAPPPGGGAGARTASAGGKPPTRSTVSAAMTRCSRAGATIAWSAATATTRSTARPATTRSTAATATTACWAAPAATASR